MRKGPLLIALALSGLAACTPVDTGFGDAHRWDVAQQVINPDPVYEKEGAPAEGGAGTRAASAVDRYNKGTVTPPVEVGTTQQIGGGSGSGSGPK